MPADVRVYYFKRKYTAPKKTTVEFWCIDKPIPKEFQILWTRESSAVVKGNKCPYCKKVLLK
jgi:hypothetical protein